MRFAVLALVAACYQPGADRACTIQCAGTADCPSGLTCATELARCVEPGQTSCVADDAGVPDDAPDGPPAANCYGTPPVRFCFAEPPSGALTVTTTACSDVRTLSTGIDVCVVAADTIRIDSSLVFNGGPARVFIGVEEVAIAATGLVDVASRAPRVGPGANPAVCPAHDTVTSRTGAAGGSFQGTGGNGGDGGPPGGTNKGALPGEFHGGCDGGKVLSSTNFAGGHAGGGVYFISATSIVVEGLVNASGSGGTGGDVDGGGGGAGSGGFIGFDAPSVRITGTGTRVLANGGGGGGGGGDTGPGGPGIDPAFANPVGAGGQQGSSGGAAGGRGSGFFPGDLNVGETGAAAFSGGAGGGGGSAGFIRLFGGATTTCAPPLCEPGID